MPWRTPTRQEVGLQEEAIILKLHGARQHPGSGSGQIKEDGSTDEEIIQIKTVNSTVVLKGIDIQQLWLAASRTNKRARLIVFFDSLGLRLEGEVLPGRGKKGRA